MKGEITFLYYFTFLQHHLKFKYTLKSYLEESILFISLFIYF